MRRKTFQITRIQLTFSSDTFPIRGSKLFPFIVPLYHSFPFLKDTIEFSRCNFEETFRKKMERKRKNVIFPFAWSIVVLKDTKYEIQSIIAKKSLNNFERFKQLEFLGRDD